MGRVSNRVFSGGGGGGDFVSGEQWVCKARLARGGVLPKKVSALRLILVGFGNQALTTVVIAPVPAACKLR